MSAKVERISPIANGGWPLEHGDAQRDRSESDDPDTQHPSNCSQSQIDRSPKKARHNFRGIPS